MLVMAGATAVGGGDFTVLVDSVTERDTLLLLVVDSVTMAWAHTGEAASTMAAAIVIIVILIV